MLGKRSKASAHRIQREMACAQATPFLRHADEIVEGAIFHPHHRFNPNSIGVAAYLAQIASQTLKFFAQLLIQFAQWQPTIAQACDPAECRV